MYLHIDNKELFKDLIAYTSEKANIREDIIEKDYYVTLILQELSKISYPIVFKGGTSLSKAYGVIDRFSEDIDITFSEHIGEARRKKLKYNILKPIADKLGLVISNWENIESDKDLNRYVFSYNSIANENTETILSSVIIETSLMSYSFPTNNHKISNYLYETLKSEHQDVLRDYELLPFDMTVQSLERTLIDKIFAICDYYLLNKPKKNARHLYDIYKLKEHVEINTDFIELVNEVRNQRLSLGEKIAPAAFYDVDIKQVATKLCESDFYKQDFEDTTAFMISERIAYDVLIDNYLELINQIWD